MWNEKYKLYKSRLYIQKFNYIRISHTAKQGGSKTQQFIIYYYILVYVILVFHVIMHGPNWVMLFSIECCVSWVRITMGNFNERNYHGQAFKTQDFTEHMRHVCYIG